MNLEQQLNNILSICESKQSDSETLQQLNNLCKNLKIPITVIGGIAVASHGYKRFTNDIDLLIKRKDAPRLANSLIQAGWTDIGNNKLQNNHSRLIINLCAEGVKAGQITFPPPTHNEPGIKVIELPQLIILKIQANRHKDRSDIVELIKANKLTEQYINDNIQPYLPTMDQKLLTALWKIAERETSWLFD